VIGKTLGHYRITEKLGSGGMGVVYKARDLHLDRFVALKVLPPEKVADAERKRRFTQEAKAASALNHPNIVHIYDITADQDVDFIAMEYVEGKTLEQMIGRRSLRLNDTLKYAVQIADALAKAHAAGIVHRDLKPANVMINEDGTVKVLDFGLAKLTEHVQGDEFATTATAEAVTEKGAIVGTVAYMSPEQAEGRPVDPRSDIFSFGSVLYEMVTGRRAFQGESKIAILSGILNQEPSPVSEVSGGTPQELERIITRCLKKDPSRRFQAMPDLKVALEELKEESDSGKLLSQAGAIKSTSRFSKRVTAAVLAGGIVFVAAVIFYLVWKPAGWFWKSSPPPLLTHNQISFVGDAGYPAIWPDGKFIAYVTGKELEEQRLMLQDLSGGQAIELFKARSIGDPRWSPDGSELIVSSFMGDPPRSQIILIPRLGQTFRPVAAGANSCWSPDGAKIAVAFQNEKGFRIVDKATGQSQKIPLSGFQWFLGLDWSHKSNLVLIWTRLENGRNAISTVHQDGSQQHKVTEEDSLMSPRWSPAGNAIYFFRSKGHISELAKIPINPKSGEAAGPASVILSGLQVGSYFTLSADGSRLAYTRTQSYSNLWLAELSGPGQRSGVQTKALTKDTSFSYDPSISLDGKWVAFVTGSPFPNIYKMPIEGGARSQLTYSGANHRSPAWSPKGTQIAFASDEGGSNKVWIVGAAGGTPRRFSKTQLSSDLHVFWPPGNRILYQKEGNRNFLFLNPVTEEENLLIQDESVGWLFYPQISPDGMKVAASWNRNPRGIWLISLTTNSATFLTEGTFKPIGWSPDGGTIYLTNGSANILALPAGGGAPKTFITMPGNIGSTSISSDGRKFVCSIGESKSDVWVVENFDPARK